MLSLDCLTVIRRPTPLPAVKLIEFWRIERIPARAGVAGELAEYDASIEVVHVDPNEIQAAAQLVRQREHEIDVVRKRRVSRRVGMMRASEMQAIQTPVVVVSRCLAKAIEIDLQELSAPVECIEFPVNRHDAGFL